MLFGLMQCIVNIYFEIWNNNNNNVVQYSCLDSNGHISLIAMCLP